MGCAQTATNVLPPDHIPIEQIYDNENYLLIKPQPLVVITAPPTPAYVKSALKKTPSDGRGKTEILPFINRKPLSVNKSVNFDEQVLVKARTPTPTKVWYEKASSTMPMRKRPPNENEDDDDDYDDYDEEIASLSPDEDEDNEQFNSESQISISTPKRLLVQRNQNQTFWHRPNTTESIPLTDTAENNRILSPPIQRAPSNINTYSTATPMPSPVNRIVVRRRSPHLGPTQIAPAPLYRPVFHSSSISPYQFPTPNSTTPTFQNPRLPTLVSAYQSTIKSLTVPSSQTLSDQQTIKNSNSVNTTHLPILTKSKSLPTTLSLPIKRHPIENLTSNKT